MELPLVFVMSRGSVHGAGHVIPWGRFRPNAATTIVRSPATDAPSRLSVGFAVSAPSRVGVTDTGVGALTAALPSARGHRQRAGSDLDVQADRHRGRRQRELAPAPGHR